jgi:ABC-type phosphate transport system substrate-binding protein
LVHKASGAYQPLSRQIRHLDQAIGEFALAYADQNELVAAVKAGRIKVLVEPET